MDIKETNNQLAEAVFLSKPTDFKPVTDVYEVKTESGAINSIKKLAQRYGFSDSLASLIRGGKEVAKYFPLVKQGYQALTKGNVLDRVMASTDLFRSLGTAGLPGDWGKTVTSLYQDYGGYVAKVGDVARIVNGTDFKNLNSIGGMINRLSGEAGVLFEDKDGLAALTCSVIQEATRYGIPNSFDQVVKTISNGETIMKVANGCLPVAIEKGDIQLLGSINNALKSGNLLNSAPAVLREFSDNFKGRFGEDFLEGVDTFGELINVYDAVDVKWREYYRIGDSSSGPIDDISVFANASEDMNQLIRLGSSESVEWHDQMLVIAQEFDNRTVDEQIKLQLPLKATLGLGVPQVEQFAT